MSLRIVVLGALCVALSVAAIATRPDTKPRPPAARLPAFADVQRIALERTGQADVELDRTPAGWRTGGAPIDAFAIETIEQTLGSGVALDPMGRFTDFGRFAISDDALLIDLGDGARWRIGKVADGRHTFVRRPDGSVVYRARANLRRAFDRPADRWREHRLFAGRGPAQVAHLEMRRGDRVDWSAARPSTEAPWVFERPATADPGQSELHAVANTLSTAKADRFVAGDGFRPLGRLEATSFDGQCFGLELGPRAPDGGGLVRRLDDGVVAALPRHLLTFLDVGAADLRDRRIFTFDVAEIDGVRTGTLDLRRRSAGWWAEAPRRVALEPDAARLLIDGLAHLRAAGFPPRVPDDAFARPFGRIGIRLNDARVLTLTIGARYGERGRYVRASDRPTRVFVLSDGTVRRLIPDLETLLRKPAFSP